MLLDLQNHEQKLKVISEKKKSYKFEEITIEDIYQQIEPKYKWLKEKELELEYNSLKARSFLKDIYNYVILKKKKEF